MKRKCKQETCRCDAYSFPHRLYGGKCEGIPEEEDNHNPCSRQRSLEYQLLGCSFREFTNPYL